MTLIPGDGVGPELAEATRMCIDATGVTIDWDVQDAGVDIMETAGTPVPDSVLESCRRTKVALKAPITTPVGTGFRSVNVYLRQALDLYACVRPCKLYHGVRTFFSDDQGRHRDRPREHRGPLPRLRVRAGQARDGRADRRHQAAQRQDDPPRLGHLDQADLDHRLASGSSSTPSNTPASTAARRSPPSTRRTSSSTPTACSSRSAARSPRSYPDIEFEDRIVDNMCMQLVQKPELYDVLVLPNLYGDIISRPRRRPGRRPGRRSRGEHRRERRGLRGDARLGPEVQGPVQDEPDGPDPVRRPDARAPGRDRRPPKRLEDAVATVIEEGKDVTYDMKPHRDDPDGRRHHGDGPGDHQGDGGVTDAG